MSSSSDDTDVARSFDDRAADALLSGRAPADDPALGAFVAQLQALAAVPAPEPSAALAALLEAGIPAEDLVHTAPRSRRRRVGGWALPLQLATAAAGCLALVLGAAAANTLPDPAQTAVADAVEAVVPVHLPRPHVAPTEQPAPVVTPTATPGTAVVPTPVRTPVPVATAEHEDRTDRGREHARRTEDGDHHGDDARTPERRPSPEPTAEPRESGSGGSDGSGGGSSDGDGSGDSSGGSSDGGRLPADDLQP